MNKKESRLRRGRRSRMQMRERGDIRLVVNKTSKHIYAQVISACGGKVIVSASTVSPSIKGALSSTSNIEAAKVVGKAIGEKAISAGIKKVSFDRSGHKYHGRIQGLADAAREAGLEF